MEFELLERAAIDNTSFSLIDGVLRDQRDETPLPLPPDDGPVRCEEEEEEEEEAAGRESPHQDLDKTLTPSQTDVRQMGEVGEALVRGAGQSLAAGLVFSDEEEWESFSHGSPLPSPNHKQEGLVEGKDTRCSLVRTDPEVVVTSTPLSTSPPPQPQPQETQAEPHVAPPAGTSPETKKDPLPPPPSALAARLFPALRQERERVLLQQRQENLPQPASDETPTTPPRYPSEPELRDKLCELETEIERFRVMNSRLEQQSKEKEQVRVMISVPC